MANDSDVDLRPDQYDLLQFIGVTQPADGTAWIYDEEFIVVEYATGYSGTTSVEYTIADPQGVEDDGTVTVLISDTRADTIVGSDRRDLLIGTDGAETIVGGLGDDDIYGEAGDDIIEGGEGADRIYGGDGIDTVTFTNSNIGVVVDLQSLIGQGGQAQGDIFFGIENISGSGYSDTLRGDAGVNVLTGLGGGDVLVGRGGDDQLFGGLGNDTLDGGEGADVLDGGEGVDTATYATSSSAVQVSLASATASGGDAAGDELTSIENLTGSEFDDVLEGDDQANRLAGGRGNDRLVGGAGDDVLIGGAGADELIGGEGIDRADYTTSTSAVTVNMTDASAGGGDAAGDTFQSIEQIVGSYHDDTLIGDAGDNWFRGGRGADTIVGGDGFDTADYSASDDAVAVDLETGAGSAGEAAGDQLSGIEMLVGSSYVDQLSGSAADETFDGRFGDDLLAGRAGSDTYLFGFDSGNDTVAELGDATDIDRIAFGPAISAKDVSFSQDGNDLIIELEHDDGLLIDTLRVSDHFLGRETGIEEVVFADGTVWDRDKIDTFIRAGSFNAADDVIRFADEDIEFLITADRLLLNDASEGVDLLRIVSVGNAENGTVRIDANGDVLFTSAQDFNGDAFFDYTVEDQFGRQSTARAEVNVLPVNDAPIGHDDSGFIGIEDTVLVISWDDLLANDIDVDIATNGDRLSIVGIGPLLDANGNPIRDGLETATYGKVIINAFARTVEFEPIPDHYGFAGFTYTVADLAGATSTASVELTFIGVNDAPDAGKDHASVRLTQTKSLDVDVLLANDTDPEGDEIRFVGIEAVENGTASLRTKEVTENGITTLKTYVDFVGEALGVAYVTYIVEDIFGAQSTGTIEIQVIPLNDPPNARDDGVFETLEDTAIVIDVNDLLLNDTDPNGDPLSVVAVERFPLNGTVTLDETTGLITFTPRADYNGEAGFEYTIDDGQGGQDTAFVSITVLIDNDAPVLRDDVVIGYEDLTHYVLAAEAFANDMDPEGDVIFFESVSVLGVLSDDFSNRTEHSESVDLTSPFVVETTASGVTLGDGSPLPAWLSFDLDTGTFSGLPPAGASTFDVSFALTDRQLVTGETLDYDKTISFDPTLLLAVDIDLRDGGGNSPASVTLVDGSPLPAWLTFDSATGRLTGTAPDAAIADLDLEITFETINPDTGATGTTAVARTIGQADLAGQTGVVVEYASNTVELTLADGAPLPVWLNFDIETLTFSGVPDAGLSDPIDVTLTFTNASGLSAGETTWSDTFTIDPTDRAALSAGIVYDPELMASIATGGTFSASLPSGRPLPSWLAFDAETLEFSLTGIAPNANESIARVWVRYTPDDPDVESFAVEVRIDPQEPIDPAINALFDTPEYFASAGLFTLPTVGDAVIDALKSNLVDLPEWLSFDAQTLTFTGTPPEYYVGTIEARIDVAESVAAGTPAFAFITDIVVDDSYTLDGTGGVSASVTDERILLNLLEDFYGSFALSYTARDEKDAVSAEPATIIVNILPRRDLPDAITDVLETPEDEPVTVALAELMANDRDLDGDPIRITDVQAGSNGTIDIIVPELTYLDSDVAALGNGYTHTASLEDGSPLPTWLTVDAQSGRLSGTPPLAMLGALFISIVSTDANGAETTKAVQLFIDGNAGATVTFTPDPQFSGLATFTYTLTDDGEGEVVGLVNVHVDPRNDPPVAKDDSIGGVEDTPLTIDPTLLLANDTDVDGDMLVIDNVVDAVNGTVEMIDGQIVFTPDHNFSGLAGFDYIVSDGADGSDVGHVTITVIADNQAPVAATDNFSGTEDTSLVVTVASLLANDTDPNDDEITFIGVTEDVGSGRAYILPSGDISLTPRDNINGPVTFTYTISDGRLQTTGEIVVDFAAVNDAPIANADSGYVTDEEVTIRIPLADLIANDTDVEGDTLSVIGLLDPINGSVVIDGTDAVFTPRENYFGNAGFSYRVSDGNGGVSTGQVSLSVQPLQDLPIAVSDLVGPIDEATGDVMPILEDTSFEFHSSLLLANDYDPDGDEITFLGATGPGVEVLTDGTIRLTPTPNSNGTHEYTYTITDGSGVPVQGRFTLNVLPVDDAPIGNDDDVDGVEDTVVVIPVSTLIANDRELDGEHIGLTSVSNAVGGSVQLDGAGNVIFTPDQNVNGVVSFDYVVTDVVGSTDTATVRITLAPVNDAPAIEEIAPLTGTEDVAFAAQLPANTFSDVDGDDLTFTVTQANGDPLPGWLVFDAATLGLSGTPPQDFNGTLDLIVSASDGTASTDRAFEVVIAAVNDAPVAVNDAVEALEDAELVISASRLLRNDTDVDGDTLSIVSVTSGPEATATLDASGNITVVREPNFAGDFTLTYTVSDGTLTDEAEILVSVTPVNDPPEITTLDPIHFDEDTELAFTLPDGTIVEPDGDPLTVVLRGSGGALLPDWVTFDAASYTINALPPKNYNGTLNLELAASDGVFETIAPLTLVIDPVNDAPTLTASFSDRYIDEDTIFDVRLQQGLFTDVEGDPLTYSITMADGSELPTWMTAIPEALILRGTPPQNFNGSLDLKVTASDGQASTSDYFTFTVLPVNDPPVLETPMDDLTYVVVDGQAEDLKTGMNFSVTIPADMFSDPEGDPLQYSVRMADGSQLPAWMTIDPDTMTLSGNAPHASAGTYEIEILAKDDKNAQNSDTFSIVIQQGNAVPVARDDGVFTVYQPQPITITSTALLANDTDADTTDYWPAADTLKVTGVAGATHGTVTLDQASGNVTYTPFNGYVGADQFIYTISDFNTTDGSGGGPKSSASATVHVNVSGAYSGYTQGTSGDDTYDAGKTKNASYFGGEGNDYIAAGSHGGTFAGGAGNDTLIGSWGANVLNGDEGDDRIIGGIRDDIISGGTGSDLLTGGRGFDTFIYRTGDGSDTITDFETYAGGRGDTLQISIDGIDSYDDLMAYATEQDGGVLFAFGNGDQIFLEGTLLAALDDDSFTFV